jgi:hypothetical protein
MENMNSYQTSKARRIVAVLCAAQAESSLSRHELTKLVTLMSADQWRAISFAAGVAVADITAKAAVLAYLRERAPHAIGTGR